MSITYAIDSKHPGRGIAITLDLASFAMAKEDILPGLSMSEAQLNFVQRSSLPAQLDGVVTTLYYPFGAVRVRDHVVLSAGQLIQRNLPWVGLSLREEDSLLSITPVAYDLRPLAPIRPLGRAVTLAVHRRVLPNEAFRETIQVHILPDVNRRLLQYRYEANDAYGLIMRLAHLKPYAGENAMTIGNVPLRTFF